MLACCGETLSRAAAEEWDDYKQTSGGRRSTEEIVCNLCIAGPRSEINNKRKENAQTDKQESKAQTRNLFKLIPFTLNPLYSCSEVIVLLSIA